MTDLEARYGRSRNWSRRQRRIGIAAGVAALALATLALWWVGTEPGRTALQTRDLGFTIVDASTVEVIFEVSVDAGTEVSCAVEALNSGYSVVGWVELDLPASEGFTSIHRVEVRTSEQATTGLVSECWLS